MSIRRGLQAKIRKLRSRIKPWRATEKLELQKALQKAKGDKRLAAGLLRIGKTTLWRKVERFRLKSKTYAVPGKKG